MVVLVFGYLDLVEVVQVIVSIFEVQDLQVVALEQVVELEVVILEYWYFDQATVEIPSIGLQTVNSLEVVAIGFAGFSIGSVGQAKVVGNYEAIGVVADCFAQHYSSQVDIEEDIGNYSFAIDYHMNLNFAKGLEAYLDIRPMVGVEKQKILSHHLHLS